MLSAAKAKASGGKRSGAKDPAEALRSDKRRRDMDDSDPEIDSDFKEIVSMLRHIKDKAHKDGVKKTEQAISSVATEIQSMVQDTKTKFEKERQTFLKALTKTFKECEGSLKTEYTKFEATHDKFCKDKAAHVRNFKDLFSKCEVEKEKLIVQYELQRKKECYRERGRKGGGFGPRFSRRRIWCSPSPPVAGFGTVRWRGTPDSVVRVQS